MIERRRFLVSLLAAPAIVRASSIMAIRGLPLDWHALAPPEMQMHYVDPLFRMCYLCTVDPTGLMMLSGKPVLSSALISSRQKASYA